MAAASGSSAEGRRRRMGLRLLARCAALAALFLIHLTSAASTAPRPAPSAAPAAPAHAPTAKASAASGAPPHVSTAAPSHHLSTSAPPPTNGTAAEGGHRGHVKPTWRPRRENCTAPAIEQFPRPLMGPHARKYGGLIIHLAAAFYTFLGLAIVCDFYFVSSLNRICEELKLSPDVAGATFMAAGSSAPELATVVIGVFFAKDDIGVSGVIGSAVFNIMFVISVCALCAGTVAYLSWWPLLRDCFFYMIAILAMLVTIYDEHISWMESFMMLLLYVVYCYALHNNARLEAWVRTLPLPQSLLLAPSSSAVAAPSVASTGLGIGITGTTRPPGEDSALVSYGQLQEDMASSTNPFVTAPTAGGLPGAAYTEERGGIALSPGMGQTAEGFGQADPMSEYQKTSPGVTDVPGVVGAKPPGETGVEAPRPIVKDDDKAFPMEMPGPEEGQVARIWWCLCWPIHKVCQTTTPDCRQSKWRHWYPVTFLVSMFWISFYSYIMVWMITIIGSTLGIPDTVMGLTFVAAGVSVPDALSSLAVIKEGYGDMAVSNAVGSNVFDILICLGLPWFIQTALIKPGSHVNVISKGLTYSTLSLLSTVAFLVIATHLNGWKLDRRYGVVLMAWYLLFILFASLYELNVFGYMNPPECPSDF
ncbi:probable sodium/potassium/calcium exchanger CG1090 [Ischnura elegans]|uniref:probable sodium/potassium/calcium exchanger CG1090 n=1 Tax=Ischnura elegans TaxID=197161 RepID=UPI001ED8733E|nr:probable sodium/potassium/calcium exchanger CG1090 [Ischnura elegans]